MAQIMLPFNALLLNARCMSDSCLYYNGGPVVQRVVRDILPPFNADHTRVQRMKGVMLLSFNARVILPSFNADHTRVQRMKRAMLPPFNAAYTRVQRSTGDAILSNAWRWSNVLTEYLTNVLPLFNARCRLLSLNVWCKFHPCSTHTVGLTR